MLIQVKALDLLFLILNTRHERDLRLAENFLGASLSLNEKERLIYLQRYIDAIEPYPGSSSLRTAGRRFFLRIVAQCRGNFFIGGQNLIAADRQPHFLEIPRKVSRYVLLT